MVLLDGQLKFYNNVKQLTPELISSLYEVNSEILYSERFPQKSSRCELRAHLLQV